MAKYTQHQIDYAIELRERGVTFRRIGQMTGMHVSSVAQYCRDAGAFSPKQTTKYITTKPYLRNGVLVRPFTAEEDAIIRQMRSEGAKPMEIAKRLGRNLSSVLHRFNIWALNEAKAEAQSGKNQDRSVLGSVSSGASGDQFDDLGT